MSRFFWVLCNYSGYSKTLCEGRSGSAVQSGAFGARKEQEKMGEKEKRE
jgi:hypothetical protein